MSDSSQDLRDWLINEDEMTLDSRTRRLEFIVNEFGSEDGYQLFHGGDLTKAFFEEARWCFVNGQFIACVLLCQCFLENSLRSMLSAGGFVKDEWLEKVGFYDLIKKAHESGQISDEEAEDFHWTRKSRIQYIHPKPIFSERHIAHRMLQENKTLDELNENNAKKAIKIIFNLIQRQPFIYKEDT